MTEKSSMPYLVFVLAAAFVVAFAGVLEVDELEVEEPLEVPVAVAVDMVVAADPLLEPVDLAEEVLTADPEVEDSIKMAPVEVADVEDFVAEALAEELSLVPLHDPSFLMLW
jgi:hypothetical protein